MSVYFTLASPVDLHRLCLQAVQEQASKLDQLTRREIPIVWFGIAQEVRLMGDFDNWTRGFSLSAKEFSDGTFTKFQGTLGLVPVRALSDVPVAPRRCMRSWHGHMHMLQCRMMSYSEYGTLFWLQSKLRVPES